MLRFQKVKFKPTVFKKISTHAVSRHVLYGHEAFVFQGVKGLYFFKKNWTNFEPFTSTRTFFFSFFFSNNFCEWVLCFFFKLFFFHTKISVFLSSLCLMRGKGVFLLSYISRLFSFLYLFRKLIIECSVVLLLFAF